MSDTYNLDYCMEELLQINLKYCMRIVDSPECPLCNSTPGAIEHAFLECQEIYMHCGGKLSCVVRYGTRRDTIKSSDSENDIWYRL